MASAASRASIFGIITDDKAIFSTGVLLCPVIPNGQPLNGKKALKDAARGALFTKLGNAIALAARGGADADTDFALRLAIDKAKASNMPTAIVFCRPGFRQIRWRPNPRGYVRRLWPWWRSRVSGVCL